MKTQRRYLKALAALLTAILFLGGFAATASAAPTQVQKDFIAKVGLMASADMRKSGVLASLTIAQAILESGWGTSTLAKNANSLFGIKADSRWNGRVFSKSTLECYDGINYTSEVALFRAYDSWQQSVNDHSDFLRAGSRYKAVIGERNYRRACNAIHKAGYATSPDYARKLINLIETYGLTAYDIGGAGTALVSRVVSALQGTGAACPLKKGLYSLL